MVDCNYSWPNWFTSIYEIFKRVTFYAYVVQIFNIFSDQAESFTSSRMDSDYANVSSIIRSNSKNSNHQTAETDFIKGGVSMCHIIF